MRKTKQDKEKQKEVPGIFHQFAAENSSTNFVAIL